MTKPARVSNPARELETARQTADRAKAQAEELAKQVARLYSELGIANAQRNELQIKLDLATSEAKSAQSQLKDKQSYLEGMESDLKTAKQVAGQAKATECASSMASLNSELGVANAQRNELQIKLDLARSRGRISPISAQFDGQSQLRT